MELVQELIIVAVTGERIGGDGAVRMGAWHGIGDVGSGDDVGEWVTT